ncbi:APC family permease [Leekyejoonella antrihumi]|uniref:APC family permease n=1 Tax=Leekyejoonella antrihumi TaxID=1660198 RepID=A0A563DXK0_9MICO|nr:APC family permease [Leekyejoonella antrihumi]TWP34935.1 APC family permease [Leekyejoonella antrihumi]
MTSDIEQASPARIPDTPTGPEGASDGVGDRLHRSLGRVDIILLTVAATISIDTIGQIASSGGAQAFTWTAVIVLTFMIPYGLIMSELGSSFPQEGGPYVWVRLAFGRFWASLSTMFYWVTNPIWLGGSLTFLAAATWSTFIVHMPGGGVGDYAFKLTFIWLAILSAVSSLRYGKWLLNVGAVLKVLMVLVFVVTVVIYAAQHGIHGYGAGDFSPTTAGFLSAAPIILFAVVGFEAQNGAAEEMRNPAKDVPISVLTSGTISAFCYLVPVFGILAVLPTSKISGAAGFMDAIRTVFGVYGSAAGPMVKIAAALFIFVLLNQGSAWMIASDRVQAIAGADGTFPRYFGVFHPTLGTPVRVNMLSGIVATAFTVAATVLVKGTTAAIFSVVLSMAVSTLLLSYLVIFPAVLRLRSRFPGTPRPYRVPGGQKTLWGCTVLIYAWVLVGSWTTVFPGTIESALGFHYDFRSQWSVSRETFETFTLGTLGIITLCCVAGYVWARRRDDAGQDFTATIERDLLRHQAAVAPSGVAD